MVNGGIDFYTNAIFDIYQDCFEEGIFTGKGIYDVKTYNKILENEIPENTVLSHDLLEGNYLRCGLLSDIELLDGFPSKYIAYIKRNHRWVRGDWQITKWLFSINMNALSKFKIYDNLRRSVVKPVALFLIILGIVFNRWSFVIFSIISFEIIYILDIINYVLFKKSNIIGTIYSNKNFSKSLEDLPLNLVKIILELAFLPYEAIKNIDAIIRVINRKKKGVKLLEWTTAEDGEKACLNTLKSYYKEMFSQIIFGIFILIFKKYIFGVLWIISPIIAWKLSLENSNKNVLTDENREYLMQVAKDTWRFFSENISEENNYLIIDNYQEDRKNKIVSRTSSTNIGLELISIISAYDFGFIQIEECMEYLAKVLDTINKLSKWNGHLYNWYDTKNLNPLIPRFISTVDSGNFVGYLFIVKQFLIDNSKFYATENLIQNVENLIAQTDFSYLYSEKNKLFSVGFNLEENKLIDSYYDFLASEARQASVVAITKRDVPLKHWNNLSRTLTVFKGYKGLVSWTGTAFEYLMPNINLKQYTGSLLNESSKFAILSQIQYCNKFGIPWGISESAYNTKDFNLNYQYKAFGIPWLGLKRGLDEDLVISPYSTCLAMPLEIKSAIQNLKRIESLGGRGKYGFFESIDFTPNRLKVGEKYEVVKTYMAHHQGLILNSLNNVVNSNVLEKRFNKDSRIEAVNILLQERMPVKMIITKDKKKKVEKLKNENLSGYIEREIEKSDYSHKKVNIISNENYQIFIDNFGNGYSKYKDKLITEYKSTIFSKQGIFFYLKSDKRIIELEKDAKVIFALDKAHYVKIDGNLKLETQITLNPNYPVEIRRVKISNIGNSEEVLELFCEMNPILSKQMQHYAHPEFNRMFLNYEKTNDMFIVSKKEGNLKEHLYLGIALFTDDIQIIEKEFEIDKEKFYGRENLSLPLAISQNRKLDSNIVKTIDSMLALKNTFKLKPNSEVEFSLILSCSEDKNECIESLNAVKGKEEINKVFDLSKIRIEEELKYLRMNAEQLQNSMKLLDFIYDENLKKEYSTFDKNFEYSSIWKYGISGDYPIILFDFKNIDEIYIFEEFIDMYFLYRTKNIFLDVVIILHENNVYENYMMNMIEDILQEKQINYLKNQKTGIYILNEKELLKEDFEFLNYFSTLKIDGKKGTIKNYIKELEDEYENNFKDEKIEIKKFEEELLPCNIEAKDFYNGIGGFIENGKEYIFAVNKIFKLPAVWSNIISNKFFGCITTENMVDSVWSKNCRLNRLLPWNNNSIQNISPEIFYIFENSKKRVWTLNSGIIPNDNFYNITYGFGYTKYRNITDGIIQETKVYVPSEEKMKVTEIRFKNVYDENRKLKIIMLANVVLGEEDIFTQKTINAKYDNNVVYLKNLLPIEAFKNSIVFFSCSKNIKNVAFKKIDLLEEDNYLKPFKILKDNKKNTSEVDCVILEVEVELKAYEDKKIIFLLGENDNFEKIDNLIKKYKDEEFVKKDYEQTKQNWSNLLNTIWISTPSKEINYLFNGWLGYQTISSRIFAKGSFYQSGGAIGFRDQLQDCLGMKWLNADLLKNQILKCCNHQFIEGDVLHWWHDDTKRGIRTKFSDDLLWLPYSVIEYVEFTNDYNILDEEVEYLIGDLLKENEQEKYDIYYSGKDKDSVYKHCIRAIEKSLNFGKNGLPKIGAGDWNDGFSNVGSKGSGESVWLGFFLYDILNRFEKIIRLKNDVDLLEKYSNIKTKLKLNLNTIAWDGRWYRRAIDDDGNIIGSIDSEECKIDGISQSWAIISEGGENDKKYICLESSEKYLVDRENKIIKLFTPAFENSKINPGYIKAYPNGVRENGGQYTHRSFMVSDGLFSIGFR